jgi:ribosomal protein S18 acetylase RimI-like enzyme
MYSQITAIRRALPSDAALLASLIRNSHRDVAETYGLTWENCPTHPSNCTPHWIETDYKKGISYFIQMESGIPVGCVAIEKADDKLYYIERLSVLPNHRRRGFGHNLMAYGIQKIKQSGGERISVAIIARNTSLKRWYLKMGFTEKETRSIEHLPFDVTFLVFTIGC